MEADTIVAHEMPRKPQRDTRRSWRVMCSALVWLCSGAAAIIGYNGAIDPPGDSKAKIAEFESRLTDYIDAADANGYASLHLLIQNHDGGIEFNPYEMPSSAAPFYGVYPIEPAHPPTADLRTAEARLLAVARGLTSHNLECAKVAVNQAECIYEQTHNPALAASWKNTPLTSWKDEAEKARWEIPSPSVMKSLGVAAVAAIGTSLVVWLLVVAIALVWWFLIDRLRDIARAVRGD